MGFALNPTYAEPENSHPASKKRVWEIFSESGEFLSSHRLASKYLSGKNASIPTKLASGRTVWLSRDPIQENGGINLYAYVSNNPINLWDPNGLEERGPGLPEKIGLDEPEGQLGIAEKIKDILQALKELKNGPNPRPVIGSAASTCTRVMDPMVKLAKPEVAGALNNIAVERAKLKELIEGTATTDSQNALDKRKVDVTPR